MASPRFTRSAIEWSSKMFSLRSTDHTCQSFVLLTMSCASGSK